jgi:hypothetical protein
MARRRTNALALAIAEYRKASEGMSDPSGMLISEEREGENNG